MNDLHSYFVDERVVGRRRQASVPPGVIGEDRVHAALYTIGNLVILETILDERNIVIYKSINK
jgi:hypothetical protein